MSPYQFAAAFPFVGIAAKVYRAAQNIDYIILIRNYSGIRGRERRTDIAQIFPVTRQINISSIRNCFFCTQVVFCLIITPGSTIGLLKFTILAYIYIWASIINTDTRIAGFIIRMGIKALDRKPVESAKEWSWIIFSKYRTLIISIGNTFIFGIFN